MAYLKLYKSKLTHNYNYLSELFLDRQITWGVVSKLLCGNTRFLREVIDLGITELHDTRISNLKAIKKMAPHVQTVYIKPPAKRSISSIIKYADVSFNTDLYTLQLLSKEALSQQKKHKVIIMIEMGDLREGVMGEDLVAFYEQVFRLPNLQIVGIGTNLNCLNGVLPNQDKLIQLSLYKQLIEAKFKRNIPWISGGTSVTLAMLIKNQLPAGVNHFRVGETLFFGNDLFTGKAFPQMKSHIFRLFAEIIELYEKPMVPIGAQGENVSGHTPQFNEEDMGKTSYRAIIDVGLLDINPDYLTPVDPSVHIIEASSDMLVVDLGDDPGKYSTGSLIAFNVQYMGVLALMNSHYIDKVVEEE